MTTTILGLNVSVPSNCDVGKSVQKFVKTNSKFHIVEKLIRMTRLMKSVAFK